MALPEGKPSLFGRLIFTSVQTLLLQQLSQNDLKSNADFLLLFPVVLRLARQKQVLPPKLMKP